VYHPHSLFHSLPLYTIFSSTSPITSHLRSLTHSLTHRTNPHSLITIRLTSTLTHSLTRSLNCTITGLALCHGGQTMTTNAVSHPTVLRVVVPSLLLWLLLTCLPGLHQEYIQFLNFCVEYFIWWLGLGE
jgi:hypothetical protein